MMVLFPAPFSPTMAMRSPGLIVKFISRTASSTAARYVKETFSKTMLFSVERRDVCRLSGQVPGYQEKRKSLVCISYHFRKWSLSTPRPNTHYKMIRWHKIRRHSSPTDARQYPQCVQHTSFLK